MNRFLLIFVACCCIIAAAAAYAKGENQIMKIKLSFDDKEVIVRMFDNPAAAQVLKLLPASFEFIDFAGEEKIADFPAPLVLTGAPRGMVAAAGKMFIYAPWGNLGIFYKDHGSNIDTNLIPLGEIENGLEHLTNHKGGFSGFLEIIN